MLATQSRPGRSRFAAAALFLVAGASLGVVGCRNLAEQRAVRRFGDALSEESLASLADATTPGFQKTALDHDTALDDLRLLRLPKHELEVKSVTDVPEEEWRDENTPECLVIVETPPPTRQQARFKLVRADVGRWLVDDVLLKQTRGGVKAVVSVTEQLELLAAVRGFTQAWGSGSQEEQLAVVTPELREELAALPPSRMAELAGWVVDGDRVAKLTPKTEMDDDEAAVQFAGRGYTLLVSLEKRDGAWLVTDAAAENRGLGPKIPSLERTCVALTQVSKFLDAYAAGDHDTLKTTVAAELYNGCLRTADLASVPLPTAADLDQDSSFKIHGDSAEVVVTNEDGVFSLTLTDPHRHDKDRRTGVFQVSEVTIRNGDGEQRMLATIFTARAAVGAFAAAAAAGDLHALKASSTRNLTETVWAEIEAGDLAALPLADAAAGATGQVLVERHAGPRTEITIATPAGDRTFVLKEEGGAAKVDDVLAPSPNLPESFKETCELILPARAFARSLAKSDLPGLQRASSDAFNRLVWHQLRDVPPSATVAATPLNGPPAKATPLSKGEGARCELHYGTEKNGVVLSLVREHGRLVTDDVELVSGVHPDARVALKQGIREQMADGTQQLANSFGPRPVPRPTAPAPLRSGSGVRQVGFEVPADEPAGGPSAAQIVRDHVQKAVFEQDAGAATTPPPADPPADPPPGFDPPGLLQPLPSSIAPVKGLDAGPAAPFGEPLPLGDD